MRTCSAAVAKERRGARRRKEGIARRRRRRVSAFGLHTVFDLAPRTAILSAVGQAFQLRAELRTCLPQACGFSPRRLPTVFSPRGHQARRERWRGGGAAKRRALSGTRRRLYVRILVSGPVNASVKRVMCKFTRQLVEFCAHLTAGPGRPSLDVSHHAPA
jgi:hypothetical protein